MAARCGGCCSSGCLLVAALVELGPCLRPARRAFEEDRVAVRVDEVGGGGVELFSVLLGGADPVERAARPMLDEPEVRGDEVFAGQFRPAGLRGDAEALLAAQLVACASFGVLATFDDVRVAEAFEPQLHRVASGLAGRSSCSTSCDRISKGPCSRPALNAGSEPSSIRR